MTVALVLADEADAGLCGRLAALGVQRVDATERTGPGLLTVADAARGAGERVLICAGDDGVPEEILARLLEAGGTAAFTGLRRRRPGPRVAARYHRPVQAVLSWWTRLIWPRSQTPPNRLRPLPLHRSRSARCSANSGGAASPCGCSTPGRTGTARLRS
jgi:hypothetical protein